MRERFSASASPLTISLPAARVAEGHRLAAPPRAVPDRATWYAKPYKVFDNLYFIGTRIHSAWALTTSAGIIVIDTLFDYAIEPEMIEGMTTLGLNPRDIKYVLISHAHGDHDQGAALLQSRYGCQDRDGCSRLGCHAPARRIRSARAACRNAISPWAAKG